MKNILFLFLTVTLISCDPNDKDIFNLERVKVGAILSNNNPTINLGDTLKINVKLPNDLSSTSGTINVQSLQRGHFFLKFRKIDTINNSAILLSQPTYWTTKGSISNSNGFDFEFNNNAPPFEVNINFKPQEKGIYYAEVASQAGQLEINNAYSARLVVDFNVPSRNVNLAAPFFTPAWAAEAQSREFGVYVFRVI
jgi:hypothetical protein